MSLEAGFLSNFTITDHAGFPLASANPLLPLCRAAVQRRQARTSALPPLRIDPLAPQSPSPPNDLAHAADAAADAGYRPQAGGERRGMTW